MFVSAKIGSEFPDYDWEYSKLYKKTLGAFIISKLIQKTGGKHRSRHTHSLDISLLSFVFVNLILRYVSNIGISFFDIQLLSLILYGICLGWVSHVVCDMFTYNKVRLFLVFK